jgi:hypothetical protein
MRLHTNITQKRKSGSLAKPARRDCRVRVRMPVHLRSESRVRENDEEAYTIDLSSLGIRIHTVSGLTPGATVAITPRDEEERPIEGRVAWVGSAGTALEGQAGIEFLNSLFRPV